MAPASTAAPLDHAQVHAGAHVHGLALLQHLTTSRMQQLETLQLSILRRAQTRVVPGGSAAAPNCSLEELAHDVQQFYAAWQDLSSTASTIVLLDPHPGVRKQAAQMLGQVNALEAQLTSSQPVFASLQALLQSAHTTGVQCAEGQPVPHVSASGLRTVMLHMQRQGYHVDPAAWSVVLTREEKLRLLEDMR